MPRTFTFSTKGFDIYDAGVYTARLMKWEDDDGEFGPQIKLFWSFLDDDSKVTDSEIVSWVNAKPTFSGKSKLMTIASVLLGKASFEDGEELDLDALIGRDAILTVSLGPTRDGQGQRNRIEAFSPIKRAVKAVANGGARKPF